MKLSDAGYDTKLQQLVKDTQHHVKEEESSVATHTQPAQTATRPLSVLCTHLLSPRVCRLSDPACASEALQQAGA